MSHVATVEIEIKDLRDLQAACTELGLEWREGQQTYRWYGTHVGDYPLPEGFAIEDLGCCVHAIALNDYAYEVGVVRRRDGKPGWTLMWDFFAGGYGLQAVIGDNANRLKQSIANAAAIRVMTAQGYRVSERKRLPNGTISLQFAKG